jgi:dTDP-4-amino-4,6-dideoxygalactose transaminase
VDITKKEYAITLSLLLSSRMLEGEYVRKFESMFAEYITTRYAISMPSARLGLYLLFKYFNFPEGSEVIITPFTHWSIFAVIKSCRLRPVFVDIDAKTCNIDHELVRKYINKNTKLLILTHMWGGSCQMDAFLKVKNDFNVKIIEDCAMACGATYRNQKAGSFGDASIFSFGKAKAISTFGGGMLCTNEQEIFEFIKSASNDFVFEKSSALATSIINSAIANILTRPEIFFFSLYPVLRFLNIRDPYNPIEHKKDTSSFLDEIPRDWKVKLSNIQAAVGIEQLNNLDRHNQKRIENALILNEALRDIDGIGIPSTMPETKNIYLYYTVLIKKKVTLGGLREYLIARRIDSQLNELTSSKELKVFGANSEDYPVFKDVSQNLLILPNGIYLSKNDALYVGRAFKEALESISY